MSIWCSWPEIGTDPLRSANGPQPRPQRGTVISYATGWSNHYPDAKVGPEQPSHVAIAHIPSWCVPGRDEVFDDRLAPWVRLDVLAVEHDFHAGGQPTGSANGVSVILNENAAKALVADLQTWLAAPKVRPARARRSPEETP